MAKKQSDVYDDIMNIMQKAAADAGIHLAAYDELTVQGVPIPPLSLQWLINSDVWPVGRTTSSAGNPKTNKSTFAYQLLKWFIQAGGVGQVIDTEDKPAQDVLAGIMNSINLDPEQLRKRSKICTATSMEQWQSLLLGTYSHIQKVYKTPEACPTPIINIVDSITGANSIAGTDELLDNEGGVALSRVGQQNAKALFQFMRDGSRRNLTSEKGKAPTAVRWPMTLHTVKHQIDRGDGLRGKTHSGGVSGDYYTSLDLVFSQGGTSSYNPTTPKKEPGCGKQGRVITISVRYSSLGPDGKDQNISVPVLAEFITDADGDKKQVLYFDWGAADAHFLAKNYKKYKIDEVLPFEYKVAQGYGERIKCERLGHTDFVSASVFGEQIQADPEIMLALQNQLGITRRTPFIYLAGMVSNVSRPELLVQDAARSDEDDASTEQEDNE